MTSKAHSGLKSKITDEMENFIMSKVNENRFSFSSELSILVGKEFDVQLHSKTIEKCITKSGFKVRSPRKVPLINNNKKKKKRLEGSIRFLLKPISFWNQ